MNNAYIPTLVAHRLLASLERNNWDLAEDAANELAELCDGDLSCCRAFLATATGSSASPLSASTSRADREARLACERLTGDPTAVR